ncbi:MAG: alpha/beta fold hydrolase [Bryobacteraceae bacterium]
MKTLVIAAALTFTVSLSAEVHKKDVDIKAPDGVNLKGTYFSAARPGPAILLLHQCNMDRHAWDGLADDLAGNGFHVLTVDFRGFGESGGSKSTDPDTRAAERKKWPSDVDAAFEYLTKQKGVDQLRVAVGGASCGVTQASDLAARNHEDPGAPAVVGHGERYREGLYRGQPVAAGLWRGQRGRHAGGERHPGSAGSVEGSEVGA